MKILLKSLDSLKWFGLRKMYYIFLKDLFEFLYEWFIELEIFAGDKHQSLVKYRISKRLVNYFDGDETSQNLNINQYFLGFGLIHYSFIRNTCPSSVLCIGSRKGFIPAILALACKDNGVGHVDFVDAGYDEGDPDKHWGGIGFWRKHDPQVHFQQIGVEHYITTHVMTTNQFANKINNKKYQYIYVDGDHSYDGVKKDYDLFWSHLSDDGFMAFHDIEAKGYLDKGKFGVHTFWQEVIKKHAHISFPFPHESGLGILQKKK
jgi:hypothetical protein